MAVPVPTTLFGVIGPHVRPDGVIVVRAVGPPYPLSAWMVTVELVEEPALVVGEVAVVVKSWNRNVGVTIWVREPLFAVTVNV